jgi:hypothetical protein
MRNKFTLAATLLAIIAVTTSATFAAPRTVPPTGAQTYQDQGNSEDMGIPYRRH